MNACAISIAPRLALEKHPPADFVKNVIVAGPIDDQMARPALGHELERSVRFCQEWYRLAGTIRSPAPLWDQSKPRASDGCARRRLGDFAVDDYASTECDVDRLLDGLLGPIGLFCDSQVGLTAWGSDVDNQSIAPFAPGAESPPRRFAVRRRSGKRHQTGSGPAIGLPVSASVTRPVTTRAGVRQGHRLRLQGGPGIDHGHHARTSDDYALGLDDDAFNGEPGVVDCEV